MNEGNPFDLFYPLSKGFLFVPNLINKSGRSNNNMYTSYAYSSTQLGVCIHPFQ